MMAGLWLAMGFLSRLPAPRVEFEAVALRWSAFWFPAVGLLIGAGVTASVLTGGALFGPFGAAFLGVLTWVLLTGALHLDGIADTFDGLSAASGSSERGLRVMKDSRIGAHGAVALVLVLGGKFVALYAVVASASGVRTALALLTAAATARLAAAVAIAHVPPATNTGLNALFHQSVRARGAWCGATWVGVPIGAAIAVATAAPIAEAAWASVLGQLSVLWAVSWLAGAVVAAELLRRFRRAFGGVTGDTHGALIELIEVAVLFIWGIRA